MGKYSIFQIFCYKGKYRNGMVVEGEMSLEINFFIFKIKEIVVYLNVGVILVEWEIMMIWRREENIFERRV